MNRSGLVFLAIVVPVLGGCQDQESFSGVIESNALYRGEIISHVDDTNSLYRIDSETCNDVLVSSLPFPVPKLFLTSLTSLSTDLFVGFDVDRFRLCTIDLSDPISPRVDCSTIDSCMGYFSGLSLCEDGTYYALESESDQLYRLNPIDCSATSIGEGLGIDVGQIGLGCHPETDILYAIDSNTDSLYTVNKGSGLATLVGPLGVESDGGTAIEFDPEDYRLYAILSYDELHEIDAVTGKATFRCKLSAGRANLASRLLPLN